MLPEILSFNVSHHRNPQRVGCNKTFAIWMQENVNPNLGRDASPHLFWCLFWSFQVLGRYRQLLSSGRIPGGYCSALGSSRAWHRGGALLLWDDVLPEKKYNCPKAGSQCNSLKEDLACAQNVYSLLLSWCFINHINCVSWLSWRKIYGVFWFPLTLAGLFVTGKKSAF